MYCSTTLLEQTHRQWTPLGFGLWSLTASSSRLPAPTVTQSSPPAPRTCPTPGIGHLAACLRCVCRCYVACRGAFSEASRESHRVAWTIWATAVTQSSTAGNTSMMDKELLLSLIACPLIRQIHVVPHSVDSSLSISIKAFRCTFTEKTAASDGVHGVRTGIVYARRTAAANFASSCPSGGEQSPYPSPTCWQC